MKTFFLNSIKSVFIFSLVLFCSCEKQIAGEDSLLTIKSNNETSALVTPENAIYFIEAKDASNNAVQMMFNVICSGGISLQSNSLGRVNWGASVCGSSEVSVKAINPANICFIKGVTYVIHPVSQLLNAKSLRFKLDNSFNPTGANLFEYNTTTGTWSIGINPGGVTWSNVSYKIYNCD